MSPNITTPLAQSDTKHCHLADRIVSALWLIYVVVFSWLALEEHDAFSTGLDLALHDHYVWNLASGYFLRNSIIEGAPTLWNYYFAPLLVALVPVYAIWSDARSLLVVQTIALATGVLPIYWYARRRLGGKLALAVAISFFLYPATEFVNLDQFHVISLSVPLLSLALYFLLTNRSFPFLVSMFLLTMVKEEAVFGALGVGLYVLLVQRKYRLGLFTLVTSSVWLLLLVYWIFPTFFGRPYFATRSDFFFGHLGNNPSEILTILFYQIEQVVSRLFSVYILQFALQLLVPLALVPLLGIDVLIVALPIYAMIALTQTPWLETHYASLPISCMYFSFIAGLERLQNSSAIRRGFGQLNLNTWLAVGVIGVSIASYAIGAPGPGGGRFEKIRFGSGTTHSTFQQILRLVPSRSVVVAQEELLPHFSDRKYIYSFPAVFDYRWTDYLVGKRHLFFFDFHKARWEEWLSTGYFEMILDKDDFILAQRREPQQKLDVRFGASLKLLGFTLVPDLPWQGGRAVHPVVVWQAVQPITERYTMVVQVVDNQGHVWSRLISEPQGGTMPTTQWEPHRDIGDQYSIDLPHTMPKGDYQLALEVRRQDGSYLEIFDANGTSLGTGIVLSSVHVEKSKASVSASELPMGERMYVDMREIRLLGFEMIRRDYQSGDVIQVGLYWRARAQPQGDYLVTLQMLDHTGQVVAQTQSRPAQNTYPTLMWSVGEVLLDWHDWQIPSTMQRGQYTLRVVLSDVLDGTVLGQANLAIVTVR